MNEWGLFRERIPMSGPSHIGWWSLAVKQMQFGASSAATEQRSGLARQ
jgi:hypothetical protein